LPAAAELYRQGASCESYFVILNGWVALSMLLDDGECQILDFSAPGAFLGRPHLSSALMDHSARCLTSVQVRAYPRKQLDKTIEHNANLAVCLCRMAFLDASRAHDHLVNLGLRGARERIAHLLLELYVRLRGHFPATAGETVQLPITQSHIAQAVGLTGVHVSRTFRIMREQRIARFFNRNLEILDPGALIRAAGLDLPTREGPHERRDTTAAPWGHARVAVPSSDLMPSGWEFQPGAIAA
jgi:CRP/FNR family transcriptional regulator